MAERYVYVPDAEIPKEHLRAIDEDHEVHDFQITFSIRFGLSDLSVSVRALSQIATALAVRESVFSLSSMLMFIFLSLVLVYTRLGPY
jgi:hypothetical protein